MVEVGRGGVFEKTVDNLLATVDSDVDVKHFQDKSFQFYPGLMRMRTELGDVEGGLASFTTRKKGFLGLGATEAKRESLLEAGLGTLMERQMTWGALFNHPRTLVVGPKAAFQCVVGATGLQNKWEDEPSLEEDEDKAYSSDIDQVILVNLCSGDAIVPGAAYSLLEIGVMRFHHESREGTHVPITFGNARFYSGDGADYDKQKTKTEFAKLAPMLFRDAPVVEANVKRARKQKVVKPELEFAGSGDGGNIEHIQAALVVLERLMRDRTTGLNVLLNYDGAKKRTLAQNDRMYKAIVSGVVPYAASDLDQGQPAVIPGHFDVERIADVIQYVMLPPPKKKGKKKKSSGERLPAANPYTDFHDEEAQSDSVDGISSLSGSDAEIFL